MIFIRHRQKIKKESSEIPILPSSKPYQVLEILFKVRFLIIRSNRHAPGDAVRGEVKPNLTLYDPYIC